MKSYSIKLPLLFFISFFLSPFIFKTSVLGQTSTGNSSAVATFHSIGFYWSGHGQSSATPCKVQYRKQGDANWSNGLDAAFDSRQIYTRPANEYRGSIVNLQPATTYQIQLTAGSATTSITTTTWSETFPVVSTTTLSTPTTISTSGTASGYRVYTGSINGGTNNIVVNASYIIIRNMTLTGADEDAILIGQGVHDIIVEGCDISGWGYVGMGSNNQAAVRCKTGSAPYRMILQRNKIHDSRDPGSGWDAGGTHALGPNGINWETPGDNNVIRYNTLYQTISGKKFMDGIGGSDNFSYQGFPGANSDVYGNYVSGVWDDGLEIEGGGINVRIWNNFTNNTFTGISSASCSIGPEYIWRNVSNVGQRLHQASFTPTPAQNDNEDRGPFHKCGSQDATFRGGRVYLFHNTMLQPLQAGFTHPRGLAGGPVDAGGPVTNVYSRNNIWQTEWSGMGGQPIKLFQGAGSTGGNPSGTNCTFDYDLMNETGSPGAGTIGPNTIIGTPKYTSSVPLDLDPAGYFLTSVSLGYGAATPLNNFNQGAGSDMGAYQHGASVLEFGVNAYLNNNSVAANAGTNITLTLPTNSTTLTGSGTTTSGTITGYAWSYVSGPTTYTIASPTAASTALTRLVLGTYVFRLTVTNSSGANATADVTVTVNPSAPPTGNAGANITLTLPTDSTTLTGSGTTPAGTITGYAWSYVSGPTTYKIASPTAASTALTGLVRGTYLFKLTVTNSGGASASANVTVIVNPAATQPPTANAGANITLILPTNSTTLTGSGTTPAGTITGYAWSYVSGPTTYTIASPNTASTALTGLVQGTYVCKLTVTNSGGASASANVTITVNPAANQPPTANAGSNITLTLPTNSTTLTGSGSDPDGTITKYAWTRVSGPTTYTIGTPNEAITSLMGLVQGVYVFMLTVTDNGGATASSNVTVTVNAAASAGGSQTPVARTENDITLTLPTNFTQLHGNTSSDPDGVIVSYQWTQLSGPGHAIMTNAMTSIATTLDLTTGIYTFELKVTDNDGASSTKTIKVTVENQKGDKPSVIVYPNPTRGTVQMQYSANVNGKFLVAIYDANKRLIKNYVMNKTQQSVTITIDLSSYESGVYFIHVVSPDGQQKITAKAVKM
jgi:hypothetical protein